jgi:hypothetical protein
VYCFIFIKRAFLLRDYITKSGDSRDFLRGKNSGYFFIHSFKIRFSRIKTPDMWIIHNQPLKIRFKSKRIGVMHILTLYPLWSKIE